MPRPGSHAYDEQRSRQRRNLEEQGVPDDRADEWAKRSVLAETDGPSPAAVTDRARGPYGEHGGGGSPGAVMELRSPAFSDNAPIPPRYTKSGEDVSPPIEWGPAPSGTVELAF